MARPTDDKKDYKVILRINGDMRTYIESKAKEMGCGLSECVRDLLKESIENEPIKNQTINPLLDEITGMLKLCGVTEVRFFERVCEMLDEGELLLTNGSVEVAKPEGLERFEAVCHERCLDPESVLDKATKAVERGTL